MWAALGSCDVFWKSGNLVGLDESTFSGGANSSFEARQAKLYPPPPTPPPLPLVPSRNNSI